MRSQFRRSVKGYGFTLEKSKSPGIGKPYARAVERAISHKSETKAAGPMKTSAKMEHLDVLRVELGTMKREHRDLDDAIGALDLEGRADPLTLRRLKKRKLALKDQIARIEDQLTPDIIA
jgi:hypothetical protein